MSRTRAHRGFTLIEMMMTVAIVGALASIALPAFNRYLLRAKTAERAAIMMRVKQAVQDYYIRNGTAIPSGVTSLVGNANPPGTPTPLKRTLSPSFAAWNTYFSSPNGGSSLPVEIEGGVYYRYSFTVNETPATSTFTVQADGDLDGDGLLSVKTMTYTRINGVYQLTAETPPAGEEDDASGLHTF